MTTDHAHTLIGGKTMARKDITDREVCEACLDAHQRCEDSSGEELVSGFELLCLRTGQPEKVVLAAMDRACDRGLIEYGAGVGSSWVTDTGRKLLNDTD